MESRNRAMSNARACDILRNAVIGDIDVVEVLRLWRFKPNKSRKNVIPDGAPFVYSETIGLVRSRTGRIAMTEITRTYENVFKLLCRWLVDNSPSAQYPFPFTSISVNYDYGAKAHRDGNNLGVSLTKSFGDFAGGQLLYWGEDDGLSLVEKLREQDARSIDTRHGMLLFDGRRAHAVAPFQGERYSLVFFTIQHYGEARRADVESLVRCSLNWPTEDALRYYAGLLGAPKGYTTGFRAQSILKYFGKAEPTASRRWVASIAALGGMVLKHIMAFAALPATILGRTDVALSTLLLVRTHPSRLCDEIL